LAAIGWWGVVLMGVVSAACLITAVGLWRGARWGYWLAVVGLIVNLLGDTVNIVVEGDYRAAVGIPVVAVILIYLARRRVREFFGI
jgi:uncharacterized membrane protein (DUF2068 family)